MRPSEMSMALRAMPRSRRLPNATRGTGRVQPGLQQPALACLASGTRPLERRQREGRVSEHGLRPRHRALEWGAVAPQRSAGGHLAQDLHADRERPLCGIAADRGLPRWRTREAHEAARRTRRASGRRRAAAQAPSVTQRGAAPIAAMSERLTASALCPSLPGSASGKKWRPATSISADTARSMPRPHTDQRGVVSHSQHRAACRMSEEASDQLKFGSR